MLSEVDANLKWHQSKKRSKNWCFCLILINFKKKKQVILMLNLPNPKTNLFWTESGRCKFSVNWLCCTDISTTVYSYSFTTRYATQIKNATVIIMKIAKAISSELVIITPTFTAKLRQKRSMQFQKSEKSDLILQFQVLILLLPLFPFSDEIVS